MSVDIQEAARIALLVEARDLWKFDVPGSREVNVALDLVPRTIKDWADLPSVSALRERGAAMLDYQRHVVERIAHHAYEVEWPEGKILAVNAPYLQSEVGEAVARTAPPPLRTALVWYRHEDGHVACSLRSAPDGADVGEMAKRRGGGGHAHAAGYRVSLQTTSTDFLPVTDFFFPRPPRPKDQF